MKKALSIILAVIIAVFAFASCESGNKTDISSAKSIADLSGAKIAAQAGTFHYDALAQIKGAKTSSYPEFADLLTALKSGAIDGYIAEEPTALAICGLDNTLDYLHFVNNSTGFTATDADTGIAVGLKTGSELREKINEALSKLTTEQRMALMEQMVKLSAGEKIDFKPLAEASTSTNGILKVAMECAYEPFNWTDLGEASVGAVPIYGENGAIQDGRFANGYDVQIARYIAASLGMELQVYSLEWDSLLPAVQTGTVDAIIAGMSPTEEREEQIDFTNVYYSSNLVVIYKK